MSTYTCMQSTSITSLLNIIHVQAMRQLLFSANQRLHDGWYSPIVEGVSELANVGRQVYQVNRCAIH